MFSVVFKNEIPLTEGATRHHLNGIGAAGICFYNREQLFIG
jgi:hypothetical protein